MGRNNKQQNEAASSSNHNAMCKFHAASQQQQGELGPKDDVKKMTCVLSTTMSFSVVL
jgi:hypothetical protein